jgi:RHS repeat-associated protein
LSTGPSSDRQYAGYYVHQRSGLDITSFRFYSSIFGRWLNRDPLDELASVNLYAYLNNSPTFGTDQSGLAPAWAGPGDSIGGGWFLPIGNPSFGYLHIVQGHGPYAQINPAKPDQGRFNSRGWAHAKMAIYETLTHSCPVQRNGRLVYEGPGYVIDYGTGQKFSPGTAYQFGLLHMPANGMRVITTRDGVIITAFPVYIFGAPPSELQ